MYGTQTVVPLVSVLEVFENDVKMYGTQTIVDSFKKEFWFDRTETWRKKLKYT